MNENVAFTTTIFLVLFANKIMASRSGIVDWKKRFLKSFKKEAICVTFGVHSL
jgi:hypothetical protein